MQRIVLVLLLASGCYQVDADVSGLSTSAGQESFAGAGPAAGQSVAIDRLLEFDGGSKLASTLRAARIDTVTLSPASGVASLDFLSSLTLILHRPGGDLPLVDASGKMTAPDGTVTLPVNVDVDPSLLAGPIEVAAAVRFIAPARAWSMRVEASLTVHGHLDVKP